MTKYGDPADGRQEIAKESFIARLPESDKKNLEQIIQAFTSVFGETHMRGGLIAVGGSTTKPLPRKDMDLYLVIEEIDSKHRRTDFKNSRSYYKAVFGDYENAVKRIVERLPGYKIVQTYPTEIDGAFGDNTMITRHDGSVTIKPPQGMNIEFIRERGNSWEEALQARNEPFVPLVKV